MMGLVNLLATGDFEKSLGTVGYMPIDSTGDWIGSFKRSTIIQQLPGRNRGGITHLVGYIWPDGSKQLRGYCTSMGESAVIGGAHNVLLAYDLGSKSRLTDARLNIGLEKAAEVLFREMMKGPNVRVKDVSLPELLVEYPMGELMTPLRWSALNEMAQAYRLGKPNRYSVAPAIWPITGQIINSFQADESGRWVYLRVAGNDGAEFDVLSPSTGVRLSAVGTQVTAGEPVYLPAETLSQDMAEEICWAAIVQTSRCGMFGRLPVEFAAPLMREGTLPVKFFENVTDMLDDGVPIVQCWEAVSEADLTIRRRQVTARFGELSPFWAKVAGSPSPFRVLPEVEAAVLHAAEKKLAGLPVQVQNAEAAKAVQHLGNESVPAGTVRLLNKYGEAGAAKAFLEEYHG